MAFTNELFNPMLDAAGDEIDEVSLHAGEPDSEGSDEVDGGGYSRQAASWSSASNGAISAASMTWPVPGDTTITHAGLWSSGGTWLGPVELSEEQVFTSPGSVTVDPLTLDMVTGQVTAQASSR